MLGTSLLLLAFIASVSAQDTPELLPPIGSTPAELPPPVGMESMPIGSGTTELSPSEIMHDPLPGDEITIDGSQPWWSQSSKWFAGPVWDYGGELGINGSSGNAEAFSILASVYGKRETEGSSIDWNLKYGKSTAAGVETQHYALWNSRWDYKMNERRFWYLKNTVEYDEFKAFDLRFVFAAGYGHHIVKNEATTLTARFGAGSSREFGGPDDDWVPESNMGLDFEHKISPRQRVKLVVDYYPSWEDYQDYRLVSDGFWEIMLNEARTFSLKIGALDRYDSTPNGAEHNDIDYYVTLVWKI